MNNVNFTIILGYYISNIQLNEKNFDQHQKVNQRNDRWLCSDLKDIPVVMHTKFPATMMLLGVLSNDISYEKKAMKVIFHTFSLTSSGPAGWL